jgi:hypothetical protein
MIGYMIHAVGELDRINDLISILATLICPAVVKHNVFIAHIAETRVDKYLSRVEKQILGNRAA